MIIYLPRRGGHRIEDGLWRWTTPHPEWKPGADWDENVGCVYWEGDDATVLVDPLIPTEDAERRRPRRARPRRRAARTAGRDPRHLRLARAQLRGARGTIRGGWSTRASLDALPAGVVVVFAPAAEEVVYWLARHGRSSPATSCSGRRAGSPCPASWLGSGGGLEQLASDLAPLLDLPVERVLTAHGAACARRRCAALASALADAWSRSRARVGGERVQHRLQAVASSVSVY